MKSVTPHQLERQNSMPPKPWSGLGQSLARATVAMQRMSGMIAEQQARLRLILSCVDDGLVIMRKDGTVVIDNPAGRDLLKSICTCGASSKPCAFHAALAEMASGTPRLIRECGTRDNPIRSDFKIVNADSGEEQIAVRLERMSARETQGDERTVKTDGRCRGSESDTGKKAGAIRSNALLRLVADSVHAEEPAFKGRILIEESTDIPFDGVNGEHVVQMLAYMVHQIVCDMNASGIGTTIKLNAGVEKDEPVLWVTHDGPQSDAAAINHPVKESVKTIGLKRHLPLFAELRAAQNGLSLKSSRMEKFQRIEIRKRSSLG